MSLDELQTNDIELRDLITERLSKYGLINDIKAQLRAAVLLTLSQDKDSRIPIVDQKAKIQNIASNFEGKLAISLIKEFLQNLNLKHTLSVFELEAGIDGLDLHNRDYIIQNNKNIVNEEDNKAPLIFSFLKKNTNNNNDLSDKEIIRGSSISGTHKNKRILPHVSDKNGKERINYKSDDSSDFSDVIDILDSSGKKNLDSTSSFTRIPKFVSSNNQTFATNSEKINNPYQTKQTNKGSINNEISYDDSFSDKSSTTKNNDDKSDEDSIKEIDIEEIDERSESRTGDITIDSERSISLDYMELIKKK